ncbi:unnamed protein product [Zymoseptoria tritici ST99CH_1A5]|uniref:Glucose-methanol-choline oxidoreductase N-terminal domain-containing protein n=2 Tax=Zymoseptoria tritici TaxID=1047171 RepID=F9XA32_ZYMTI|nr:uncharacterized protein MYCGRDRAFT_71439 [Zymoseptoria tritici IPO323]EGP88276.1 hypothetical protein MYCGRDRAFT_71439 [Zymoseptoria tritici IPO323]SMY23860.1 unnamed protein product [Zymoseptoria tritici ST99CH_1A5]
MGLKQFLPFGLFLLAAALPAAEIRQEQESEYEYIVVGSGAGGGPLASRLAREGHSTLLIEAGDDQSSNPNTTVPIFQTLVSGDPALRWDFYVSHYQDQQQAQRDPKYSYDTPNGEYTGLTPPSGATPKGVLYPRAGTLGGCVTHNALIFITAHDSDWDNIATLTGDASWSASNMGKYLDKVYEWQSVNPTDPTILLKDLQLVRQLAGGAGVIAPGLDLLKPVVGLGTALLGDPNARLPNRDSTEGFYPIPLIAEKGARKSVREHIKDTVAQGYPLTVKTDTFVTKVVFDKSGDEPKAVGVEYLEGSYLYRASPRSSGRSGTPGSVNATKEVILAGGTYNTVQMLKLSGIGPKAELDSFDIPILVDSPGVGTNMQDRYEIGLNVQHTKDFNILEGCTLDAKPHDECYKQWVSGAPVLAQRGTYATDGLAATMVAHSDYAENSDVDMFIFGSPANFTGYFPQWYDHIVDQHNFYSWYTLKAHTRNTAGTVKLRSADPLDVPEIAFNYFTSPGSDKDLASMVQALKMSRQALQRYNNDPILNLLPGSKFEEFFPGPNVQSDAELGQYIKDRTWGHHAACSAPIGADGDRNAVLDSKFRVRGVKGLRVVDASVFPKIPGVFIQAPIFVMSEKAADTILNG